MFKRTLTFGALLLVSSACSDTSVQPGMDGDRLPTALASADRVAICHLDEDLGVFFRIEVGAAAESAHLAHGDGRIGDLIPGLWGYEFDEDCAPLRDNDTPVGMITADINRGGDPPGSDRGVESPAVNMVADAQLWATSANGAQIAFMNPGGVRSDLRYAQSGDEGDGVVTFGEAFTFQPFGNQLFTLSMTGAQIVGVLLEQCQPAGLSRPFLHLGVSAGFSYDLSKTIVGSDCVAISVSNVKLNGVPLDVATTYLVTVNNFLADGGDNFPTFATAAGPRIDGGNDLQGLISYFEAFSPVSPPPTDRVNELN